MIRALGSCHSARVSYSQDQDVNKIPGEIKVVKERILNVPDDIITALPFEG